MSFENIKHNGISFYADTGLWESGFRHGFCDASLNFKKEYREKSSIDFCNAFSVSKLYLPEQNHTPKTVFINSNNIAQYKPQEADALIIESDGKIKDCAFGVLTADCIPLIFKCGNLYAVVHSGWRGLANGIIKTVIAEISALSCGDDLYALIGPCAGSSLYEVGKEVVQQIGSDAVCKDLSEGKYLLSLSGTALNIIKNSYLASKTSICDICVISNPSFYSYRRQSENAGRNLTFVIL